MEDEPEWQDEDQPCAACGGKVRSRRMTRDECEYGYGMGWVSECSGCGERKEHQEMY